MQAEQKRVAMVIAQNFEDVEAIDPKYHLESLGADVTLIGLEPGTVTGKKGATLTVDKTFADVTTASSTCS